MGKRIEVELPGAPEVFRIGVERGARLAVPMPARWIDARECGVELKLVDRRVWIVLLAHSWPLDPMAPAQEIAARDLRAVVGLGSANCNTRLKQSFERLRRLHLSAESDGPEMRIFDAIDLPYGGTHVRWRFGASAALWGMASASWMRVDMPVLRVLRGHRAARLYFLLGLRAGLRGRFWSVGARELVAMLEPSGASRSFSDFERDVLTPALSGVERATGWRVGVEKTGCRGTRGIERLRFQIETG